MAAARSAVVHKVKLALSGIHRCCTARLMRPPHAHVSRVEASAGSAGRAFRGHRRLASWRRLSYGLYLEDGQPYALVDQLRAWSLILPARAAFTHLTAAEVRGWWLPQTIPHPVFAALRQGDPFPHRAGLYVSRHPSRVPSERVSNVRLTTPAETMLAAARDLGVLDLVLMGDSALRLGHCTIDELVETAAQRRRGVPMLRRIIGLLDKRSESPWESVMRVLHLAADIPIEPQHEVLDHWGRFVARGDLWIVGTNRLHEFDGGVHREPDIQRRDLTRDRRLIEANWQRFGFTKAQLVNQGASIIASTDRLLGRSWDPERLRRWNALIANSMFGRPGRARALCHWRSAR